MKPKRFRRARPALDSFSLSVGLVGGVLLVATAKAVAQMPAEEQLKLVNLFLGALGAKSPPSTPTKPEIPPVAMPSEKKP